MPDSVKTRFENINDLLRIIIWPVLVLLIFACYHTELKQVAKILPKKLENSSKISVGSLSLEIEKTALQSGNGELAAIIKNLSEKGIRKLMVLGSGVHSIIVRNNPDPKNPGHNEYSIPQGYDILLELRKNDLITSTEPLDQFYEFVQTLKPEKNTLWESESGALSGTRDEKYNKEFTEIRIPLANCTPAQITRLENMNVSLSASGIKAFDIIVKVIAGQINKEQ